MKSLRWLFLLLAMGTLTGAPYKTYALSREPIDVVIPCCEKDTMTLDLCIQSVRRYGKNIRRIIVVSSRPLTKEAEWFNEKNYPFSKEGIALELFHQDREKARTFLSHPRTRIGWIYQQFLKLYALQVIPQISSNVLILDSDVIFLRPIEFMQSNGDPFFTAGHECHLPYFAHMDRLLPGLGKPGEKPSGIVHHMLFQRPIMDDLFAEVRQQHNVEPWKAFCQCIDMSELYHSSLSEYEIYFRFALSRTEQAHLRHLKWRDVRALRDIAKCENEGFAYVACHAWSRGQ